MFYEVCNKTQIPNTKKDIIRKENDRALFLIENRCKILKALTNQIQQDVKGTMYHSQVGFSQIYKAGFNTKNQSMWFTTLTGLILSSSAFVFPNGKIWNYAHMVSSNLLIHTLKHIIVSWGTAIKNPYNIPTAPAHQPLLVQEEPYVRFPDQPTWPSSSYIYQEKSAVTEAGNTGYWSWLTLNIKSWISGSLVA